MAEVIRFPTVEPHWEYSPKAQRRIDFLDRIEQKVFNVLTLGILGLAVTSVADWQTAGVLWGLSAGHARFQFLGLKWVTRFDDKGARWIGPNTGTLAQIAHFRPIEPYPTSKKR